MKLVDETYTEGGDTLAVLFAVGFTDPHAATLVASGAETRLTKNKGADGWLEGLSAGQVLAAVKAEAGALGYEPQIAGPEKLKAAAERVGVLAPTAKHDLGLDSNKKERSAAASFLITLVNIIVIGGIIVFLISLSGRVSPFPSPSPQPSQHNR
jgi:hypothetical protein